MKTIDARGLSCPQPVILASDAADEGVFPFKVLVDSVTARENVSRITKKKGCIIEIISENDYFVILADKQ